jgi:DNA-directed RNA polymerase sigma subunit (sigma70/sigma32)
VLNALANLDNCKSLDTYVRGMEEEGLSLIDCIEDSGRPSVWEEVEHSIEHEKLKEALLSLLPLQRTVIAHIYGLGCEKLTMLEMAQKFTLSKDAIKKAKDSGMAKLKLFMLGSPASESSAVDVTR